jgi:hypothetical protein
MIKPLMMKHIACEVPLYRHMVCPWYLFDLATSFNVHSEVPHIRSASNPKCLTLTRPSIPDIPCAYLGTHHCPSTRN